MSIHEPNSGTGNVPTPDSSDTSERSPGDDATRRQPDGIVTFLFTDIQGSTKLWERYPTEMAVALARHDAIMREAIEAHHGYVFKTVGDAFCAAFPSAGSGVRAAEAAQRALNAEAWTVPEPIRVRMGLHTGEPEVRDGDYFGQPLNRVARLLSAGHGGQILISGETQRNLGHDDVPGGLTLRDMGELRLKDLSRKERVFQAVVPGLPAVFPKLKTPPTPARGVAASFGSTLLGFVVYRVSTAPPDQRSLNLFSPASLIGGFKGIVLEISAIQEMFLLGIFAVLLALMIGAGWIWRRTSEFRPGQQASGVTQFAGQFVTFRVVTFLAAMSLIVLGSFAYQQYLWRVSLPIPSDAIGFAMTKDAAAASFSDDLADALFTQGQAQRIVVRELPVRFDARDTDRARRMGDRIGARAVLIYRTEQRDGRTEYVSYVVFTNPSIGLAIASAPTSALGDGSGPAEPGAVQVKEGVEVPALRTESLTEMIDAAAGIIAYHEDRIREAITHLQLAQPDDPDAANTGIVCFYLGNAYALDGQNERAEESHDCAIAFFERRIESGQRLGPQDRLILAKAYLERGRLAGFARERDLAVSLYEKALDHREDLLARAGGLERPSDVHATYARVYAELADIYRFLEDEEARVFWQRRALEEAAAISGAGKGDDAHVYVQEGAARMLVGDCTGAVSALERALEIDPENANARFNIAFAHFSRGRIDLAEHELREVLAAQPDDNVARQYLANLAVVRAIGSGSYIETAYFFEAAELQREVLYYDPTNLAAHRALAEMAAWRGDEQLLDVTALTSGDDLTLAKSQTAWGSDPNRRDAALEAYEQAIHQRRVIAMELQPGNIDAQIMLADAYFNRQQLLYGAVLGSALRGGDVDVAATGQQILADAEQIHRWTEPIVSEDSGATTLQRLQAWDLLLKSFDREWGWFRFFADGEDGSGEAGDAERAAELAREFRAVAQEAVDFIESTPPQTLDERDAAVQVYFARAIIAYVIDQDPAAGAAVYERILALAGQTFDERATEVRHIITVCEEAREVSLAREKLASGATSEAAGHFRRALEIHPDYLDARVGLSRALLDSGDIALAVDHARVAVELAPGEPAPVAALGLAATVAGDVATAAAAYQQLLEILEGKPAQERIGTTREMIDDLEALVEGRPEVAAHVTPLLPLLRESLQRVEVDARGTYQLPALHARAGSLALTVRETAAATSILRQALELDPLQPAALADLAMATLLSGDDGAHEIAAVETVLADPLWEAASVETGDIISMMRAEVDQHLDIYPADEAALIPLIDVLEGV